MLTSTFADEVKQTAINDLKANELETCYLESKDHRISVKARCTTLNIPADYSAENAQTIELFVAKLPSTSKQPEDEPLLLIAGGPGQAASQVFLTQLGAYQKIRQQRDIYLIDQRGTGRSTPLECDIPQEHVTSVDPKIIESIADNCLAEIMKQGLQPEHFTTDNTVEDFERARIALGIKKWNLYGVSYGTKVAQRYMALYPASLRAVILDGVVPLDLPLISDIAGHSQDAIDALIEQCRKDIACEKAFPDFGKSLTQLLKKLELEPLDVKLENIRSGKPETVTLTRERVVTLIRMSLYKPYTMSILPLTISNAVKNENFYGLARQVQNIENSLGDTINIPLHHSIMCSEDYPLLSEQTVSELQGSSKSSYMGSEMLDGLQKLCPRWPKAGIAENFHTPVQQNIPTLVLSGMSDPVTPPTYGERVATSLANAKHIIVASGGHQVIAEGCLPTIAANFFNTPKPDQLDASCQDRLTRPGFFIDANGPAQ